MLYTEEPEYLEIRNRFGHLWVKNRGREIAVEKGWLKLVVMFLSMVDFLNKIGVKIEIRQVKEKFGGLRIYYAVPENLTESQQRWVKLLSDLDDAISECSLSTCDICGNPGSIRDLSGFIATRCDEHAKRQGKYA